MSQLIWTPQALHDVRRLHRFLASSDLEAARRAAHAIRSGVKVLATTPHVGRPLDHMPSEFREWLIDFGGSGYVALYRHDGETIVILAVRHQKEIGYQQ